MARYFDGANQYLAGSQLPFRAEAKTWLARITTPATTGDYHGYAILSNAKPTTGFCDGCLYFREAYGTRFIGLYVIKTAYTWTAYERPWSWSGNTKYSIVARYDETTIEFLVDGVSLGNVALTPADFSASFSGGNVTIGIRDTVGLALDMVGAISEAAVFYESLGDGQIAAFSGGWRPPQLGSDDTLQAYWPLGGLDGDHDDDLLGAYHLTPYNSPTWADHPPVIYPSRALGPPVDETLPSIVYPGQRADSIRIWFGLTEVDQVRAVGTIPGVRIDRVGGLNGPGKGALCYTADGLAWCPPGGAFGSPVPIGGDGAYLLEGTQPGRFVRVTVYADYLEPGAEAAIHLADRYSNGTASDDVTAAEASAGDVETYQLVLRDESDAQVGDLRVWLDAACDYLAISDDGASWVWPTTEAAALQLGNLASGASATLHVRRTIPASEPYDPEVLSHLHLGFDAPR